MLCAIIETADFILKKQTSEYRERRLRNGLMPSVEMRGLIYVVKVNGLEWAFQNKDDADEFAKAHSSAA